MSSTMCKDALLRKLAADAHADPTSRERLTAFVVTFVLKDAHKNPRGVFWTKHIQTNAANFVRYLLAEDGRRLRECLAGGDVTDHLTDCLSHFYPVALIEAMRAGHDPALAKEELAQFLMRFVLTPRRHGVRSETIGLMELAGGFASHMLDGSEPRILQYRGGSARAFLRTCLKRFMLDRVRENAPPPGVQIVDPVDDEKDDADDPNTPRGQAAIEAESVMRGAIIARLGGQVRSVLSKMAPRDALVLVLSVVRELPYEEIAKMVSAWDAAPITAGHARVIRHRACQRFEKLIAQELGGEEALRDVASELGRWLPTDLGRPRACDG